MGVTVKKCHMIMPGNDCWNSVCFSCCRKTNNELADVTLSGSLFQNCCCEQKCSTADICYGCVHPSTTSQCSITMAKYTMTLSQHSPIPTLSKCDFSHTCTAVNNISADIHRMSCCSSVTVESLVSKAFQHF